MAKLYDRAGMSTTTTGTGTVTLGSALGNVSPNLAGFLSFAGAGVPNATDVSYLILDANNNWEVGHGTYTSSGTTLTRSITASSSSGSAINLSGNAQVFITIRAEDLITLDAGGNATFAGIFSITNSTASTSTTTGALQTAGGLGVQGDEWLGGNLVLPTAGKGVVFNGSAAGIGVAPEIGAKDGVNVAANASLGISAGTGLVLYRDESVGGAALIFLAEGNANIIQASSNFTTVDPGAGGNKWVINQASGHLGDVLNRYGSTHSLTYLLIAARLGVFV